MCSRGRQAGRASLEVCVCECVCEHSTHVPAVSAVTTLTHGGGGGGGDAVGILPETTLGWEERQALQVLYNSSQNQQYSKADLPHSWVRETTRAKLMDYANRKNHLSETSMLVLVLCRFEEKNYFYLWNAGW